MANYPDYYDTFVTKIDKNASGWYVSGESFNAPSSPYTIYLNHIPKDSATTYIYPSGGGTAWTEDLTGTPSAGEFYVDYDIGQLTFNSADSGTELEAVYYSLGDDIMAEHINTLQVAVSGVQYELGLGIAGIYQNLSQRLNTFLTNTSTIQASEVTSSSPGSATFTDVQGHIDAGGETTQTDDNPHGIGWDALFGTVGDMDRAQNNVIIGNLFADTLSASGNYIGINTDGPDADSFLYFYENSVPNGAWLKWDDGDDRFEFSDELLLQGGVTASGNVMPMAATPSGSNSVGTAAVAWGAGYFDVLEAATTIYSPAYLGDGSNLDGLTFTQLSDTPDEYGAFTASGVRVNAGGTGLEFCDISSTGGGGVGGDQTLQEVTDLGAVTTNDISITSSTSDKPDFKVTNTNADSTGPRITLSKLSSSAADDDVLGNIYFEGRDSISSLTTFSTIQAICTDITNTAEAGRIRVNISQSGTQRNYLDMFGNVGVDTGVVRVNDDGVDIDFVVESVNQAELFKVDAGEDKVMMTSTSTTKGMMLIDMNGVTGATGEAALRIDSENADTAALYITSAVDGTGTSAIYDDAALAVVSEGLGGAAYFHRNVPAASIAIVTIREDNADATGSCLNVSTDQDASSFNSAIQVTSTSAAYDVGLINMTQAGVTETNFKRYISMDSNTIFVSDGTTAEGALTGVEGDICLNGGTDNGQLAYCDADGTNWTDAGGASSDDLDDVAGRGAITTNAITTAGLTVTDIGVQASASGTLDIGSISNAFDDAYIDKLYLEDDPTTPLQAATKQYVDDQIASGGAGTTALNAWAFVDYTDGVELVDSYGVDSISEKTGECRFNWTNEFSDTYYSVTAMAIHSEGMVTYGEILTTTYANVEFRNSSWTKAQPNRGLCVMAIGT